MHMYTYAHIYFLFMFSSSVLLSLSAISLIVTYPLFKRFTHWPQVMLGKSISDIIVARATRKY